MDIEVGMPRLRYQDRGSFAWYCGFVLELGAGRDIDAVDPVEGQAIRARLCDFELLSLRDVRQVRAVLADMSLREYLHT